MENFIVLKVVSCDIVIAACLKYGFLVFSLFGPHKTMVINAFSDSCMCFLVFRITATM